MYSTTPGKPPKRPIVTTLAGAMGEIARWQKENQYSVLTDADGQGWELKIGGSQHEDPADPRRIVWQVRLGLSCRMSAHELLARGVLKTPEDDRLISLIGNESIPLSMRPQRLTAASEAAARQLLVEKLPEMKAAFGKTSLQAVKRELVGRWLDQRCTFGGAKSS